MLEPGEVNLKSNHISVSDALHVDIHATTVDQILQNFKLNSDAFVWNKLPRKGIKNPTLTTILWDTLYFLFNFWHKAVELPQVDIKLEKMNSEVKCVLAQNTADSACQQYSYEDHFFAGVSQKVAASTHAMECFAQHQGPSSGEKKLLGVDAAAVFMQPRKIRHHGQIDRHKTRQPIQHRISPE